MMELYLQLVALCLVLSSFDAFCIQNGAQSFSSLQMIAPKPPGIANTRAGKAKTIDRVKPFVESASTVMVVPVKGVSKENIDLLKNALPEGSKATVVKNRLLRVAMQGTPFEPLSPKMSGENIFLFLPEGVSKKTYDAYGTWRKETKRTDPMYDIQAFAMEGAVFSGDMVEKAVSLPSKKELMAKLAMTLKAIPNKLHRTIKAVPNKLGRTIAAIKEKKEKEANGGAAPAEAAAPAEPAAEAPSA